MKLDATDLRYVTSDEFRVLKAFELGSRNHEVVPTQLAANLSGLRTSNVAKLISELAKRKLVARVQNARYDGYRLTYGGYDFLAVRALSKQDILGAVGYRVGVGKESDIYITEDTQGTKVILKMHRLGRISFRNVKHKRDYLGKRHTSNWQYLSKLSASKEYLFMSLLKEHGFPVPQPLGHSRHAIVMEKINFAYPLRQIVSLPPQEVEALYAELMALIVRLAQSGLIHGDFNEFNLMIREKRAEELEYEGTEGAPSQHNLSWEAKPKRQPKDTLQEVRDAWEEPQNRRPLELRPGERIEQGKGFERVVVDDQSDSNSASDSDSESDSNSDPNGEELERDPDSDEYEEDEAAKVANEENLSPHITISNGTSVEAILIDFPQMVSVEHENAAYYFNRDVECIKRFFFKRFRFEAKTWPTFDEVVPRDREAQRVKREAAFEAQRRDVLKAGLTHVADQVPAAEDLYRDEKGVIQLDKLAQASGFGASGRLEQELEETFRSLRLGGEEAGVRAAEVGERLRSSTALAPGSQLSSGQELLDGKEQHGEEKVGDVGGEGDEPEEEQVEEDKEDEDEEEEEEEEEEGEDEHLTRAERRARAAARNAHDAELASSQAHAQPNSHGSGLPSRGAALKAAQEGDTSLVALRLAAERARKEAKVSKHHGKKAQGPKIGRRKAGGKGRNDAIAIDTQF